MQRSMNRSKIEQDFAAAARFLKRLNQQSAKMGVVGFCFGGYISNYLAGALPEDVDAAVPFYGSPAPADLVSQVKGPLLLQFAELDKRINDTWPDYQKQLDQNGAQYTAHVYPKANHGFHNDSTSRYDPEQAELAWQRTLAFFAQHLA
jgi:carboxymethylenebutenolidase